MKLLGYEEFLLERENREWNSLTIESIQTQIMQEIALKHESSRGFVSFLLSEGLIGEFFSDSINEEEKEESIIDKWKAKFIKAKEKIKDAGKDALSYAEEKILDIGANISSVINLIVEKVKGAINKAWDSIKAGANKASKEAAPKIKEKVENLGEKVITLADEIKNFKSMSSSGVAWALNGFAKEMQGAIVKAAKEKESNESLEVLENLFFKDLEKSFYAATLECIREGSLQIDEISFREISESLSESDDHGGDETAKIPFLSKIAKKLGKFPPFSWLHEVQHKAQELAKKGLDKLSYYLSEFASAPGPFEFTILAFLVGVAAELMVKTAAKSAILLLIPGIGIVIYTLKYIALGLTTIAVAEQFMPSEETEETEKTEES